MSTGIINHPGQRRSNKKLEMGVFWSAISKRINTMTDRALDNAPIMYARVDDYTPAGLPRRRIRFLWGMTMKSMITLDLPTRRFLYPVIENRIKRIEASQKYSSANLMSLLQAFRGWDEQRLFDLHDLFQVFEVDGDGLIDISEMCVGFDNLGDKTPTNERLEELQAADEDRTGSIDFEEFLQVVYNLEMKSGGSVSLGKTFKMADMDVKFIRHMSVIQQVRCGFL